jgi:hypothetical protein
MGCLHTHMGLPALLPEPFVHSKIALHGALQCQVGQRTGRSTGKTANPTECESMSHASLHHIFAQGSTQPKLAASLGSPAPWYFATWG